MSVSKLLIYVVRLAEWMSSKGVAYLKRDANLVLRPSIVDIALLSIGPLPKNEDDRDDDNSSSTNDESSLRSYSGSIIHKA